MYNILFLGWLVNDFYTMILDLAVIGFSSASCCSYAREAFNGFEYPPGCPLEVDYYREGDAEVSNLNKGWEGWYRTAVLYISHVLLGVKTSISRLFQKFLVEEWTILTISLSNKLNFTYHLPTWIILTVKNAESFPSS